MADSQSVVVDVESIVQPHSDIKSMPSSRASTPEATAKTGSYSLCLICAVGIFACYFFYGILQEKM